MASTYTTNLGIEKPGTGEQSGTWGTTANTNYDLIDQAINGIVQITLAAAGTSGSPNSLAITNGTASDGRNKYIEFIDGGDLGATAYVQLDPNDAEKIVHMRNSLSGSRSVIVFQGTYNASNDFEIPAGKDVVLKFDGAGASATVTQVFVDLKLDALDAATVAATTGNITTVNATTVDTTNLEVTNIKAKDGTSAGSIADSTGVVTFASAVLTTADINGGTMDGVTIGGASTAAGSFTTVTASGRVTFGELKGTGATVVSTILDEDNMTSNSDTALATQQSIKAYVDTAVQAQDTLAEILANGNTTGANNIVVTSGQVITTDTINETSAGAGVNIDSVVLKDGDVNATIGATTAKAANFTTMGASSNATVGGTLGVTGATTLSSSLSVNTGAVFNEGGGDNDFRVESDNNEYALFVDASADAVKIGQSSGTQALNVNGNIAVTEDDFIGFDSEAHYMPRSDNLGVTGNSSAILSLNDIVIGTRTNQAGTGNIYIGRDATTVGGTGWVTNYFFGDNGNAVFNDSGADADFRVESDSNTHMLFVDAGNNAVGIGGTPLSTSPLTVVGQYEETAGDGYDYNIALYPDTSLAITQGKGTGILFLSEDSGSSARHAAAIQSERSSTVASNYTNNLTFKTRENGQDMRDVFTLFGGGGAKLLGASAPNLNFLPDGSVGNADISFNGSDFIIVSNSSSADLKLKTNSTERVRWTATGGVTFNEDSNDYDFRVESDSNANMIFADAGNSQVNINNNVGKAHWSSNGILDLNIAGAKNYPGMSVMAYSTTSNAGGMIVLGRSRSATAGTLTTTNTGDQHGYLLFEGVNGNNTLVGASYIESYQPSGTSATTVPGRLRFFTATQTALPALNFQIDSTAVVSNENGADQDFRVESDNNSSMLVVDAGSDQVRMGTSTVLDSARAVIGDPEVQASVAAGGTWTLDLTVRSAYFFLARNEISSANPISGIITTRYGTSSPDLHYFYNGGGSFISASVNSTVSNSPKLVLTNEHTSSATLFITLFALTHQ